MILRKNYMIPCRHHMILRQQRLWQWARQFT